MHLGRRSRALCALALVCAVGFSAPAESSLLPSPPKRHKTTTLISNPKAKLCKKSWYRKRHRKECRKLGY